MIAATLFISQIVITARHQREREREREKESARWDATARSFLSLPKGSGIVLYLEQFFCIKSYATFSSEKTIAYEITRESHESRCTPWARLKNARINRVTELGDRWHLESMALVHENIRTRCMKVRRTSTDILLMKGR